MNRIGSGPAPPRLTKLAAELDDLGWKVTLTHRFSYLVLEGQYCSGVELVAVDPQREHQLYLDYVRPQGQQPWNLRAGAMSNHPPTAGRFGRIRRLAEMRQLAHSPLQARREWLALRAEADAPTRRQFLHTRATNHEGKS